MKQIEADIARLNGARITKAMLNVSKTPAHNVHYSIIDNRLYAKVPSPPNLPPFFIINRLVKVIGTVVDVREFVEAFLLSLLRKVVLRDAEFVINYRLFAAKSLVMV